MKRNLEQWLVTSAQIMVISKSTYIKIKTFLQENSIWIFFTCNSYLYLKESSWVRNKKRKKKKRLSDCPQPISLLSFGLVYKPKTKL